MVGWRRALFFLVAVVLGAVVAPLAPDGRILAPAVRPSQVDAQGAGGTWSWLNPRPQGNNIAAVACASQRFCYAAGGYGTVLGTHDHGVSWLPVPSGTHADLTDISCPADGTCAVVSAGVVRVTHDQGKSWSRFSPPLADALDRVTCPSTQACYALGYDATKECATPNCHPTGPVYALFVTTDGGRHWRSARVASAIYLGALACGAPRRCVAIDDHGIVYGTANAARSWARWTAIPKTIYLQAATCATSAVCYLAGVARGSQDSNVGIWLRSTDGGHSWSRDKLPGFAGYGAISCVSAVTCIVTAFRGELLVTRDGGRTWQIRHVPVPAFPGDPGSLACESIDICHVVGPASVILTTLDGAAHWRRSIQGSIDDLRHIVCPGAGACRALASNGHLLVSDDGGVSWSRRADPLHANQGDRIGLSCPDVHTCTIVGPNAVIFRSDDAGLHWQKQESPLSGTAVALQGVSCPDTQTCFATGTGCLKAGCNGPDTRSVILRTTDGGGTWQRVFMRRQDFLILDAIACPDQQDCVVTGSPGAILVTHDGEKTWQGEGGAVGASNADLSAVTCADSSHCIAVGWGCASGGGCTIEGFTGVIRVTADGGKTWADRDRAIKLVIRGGGQLCGFQAKCYTAVGFNGVSCVGGSSCWIAGGTGVLLHSQDQGTTWAQEPKATDIVLTDVACPTTTRCYAVGEGGAILRFDM